MSHKTETQSVRGWTVEAKTGTGWTVIASGVPTERDADMIAESAAVDGYPVVVNKM